MSTQAANTKLFFSFGVLVGLTIATQPVLSQTSSFEPICQVSSFSGFCRYTPSAPLVTTPTPEPSPYTDKDIATYDRPFDVNSLWNIRPRQVIFGSSVIPTSTYFPLIGTGKYSTTAFEAKPSDESMTVYPPPGAHGVWDPDSESNLPSITIPHWPADTVPASGTDGHADIVDAESGIIHSFWQLRKTNGRWTAVQYAWSRLDGRGWGDGVHYFQGARAAGVPSMAGLIRKKEINDGASQYYHALAMSLTYTGMSQYEQYVFPATSGDRTWKENSGRFPTGALLMLPPTFDSTKISNPDLRKVVNTLKTYGAYVIDRNVGTPFYIYVENGTNFNLHKGGWNSPVGNDLHRIREALRQVTYAKDWVNNRGEPVQSLAPLNLTTMRGPWKPVIQGAPYPVYDSLSQSAVFGPTDKAYAAESGSGRSISRIKWAKPEKGKLYEFRVHATNGGRAYLRYWGGGVEQFHTRPLADGETFRLHWPSTDGVSILGVVSGVGEKTSIRTTLTEVIE
ncbi:Atrophin-1 multi-domain protein [Limnobacter parvus]|uniref:Atrophin-1 multi-domain protein n=1 Tax=Limnobacter parvus TaxID=2939690 RepID=A0ABT1XF70_9BURK|nr:Atrophin-1 multi-domain protein [Limnobacter parvus]MCR2745926.1 Atrophin-1 multi-domain protein [Limnobacter parvus]